MIVQRADARIPMPWRNGKGIQYEIAADGPLQDGWTWRVSTAEIGEDVPFSMYPGVAREFCVAEGDGVVLTIDGTDTRCETYGVVKFRGDALVAARLLGGPVRALNLMRLDGVSGESWRVLRANESGVAACIAVALGGGATVVVGDTNYQLETLDALLECAGLPVTVVAGVIALC